MTKAYDITALKEAPAKRKSPIHKLDPSKFKEQVQQLSDNDLKSLETEIATEKSRRREELQKRLALLGEEGK